MDPSETATNANRINRLTTKLRRVIDGERNQTEKSERLSYIEMIGVLVSVQHDLLHEMGGDFVFDGEDDED